jgi:CheY-like chemotaxis protein
MTNILIVDDDPSIADVLSEIVETYGYQSIRAASAKEAASALAKGGIDLILLDLSMPEITGDQFLGFIRKRGFKVPVVVVSAHVEPDRETELRASGISGVVRKPFEVADVIDQMEQALQQRT